MAETVAALRAKYMKTLQTALDDSKAAGKVKTISIWYTAYLHDFTLTVGYADRLLDKDGKLHTTPKNEKSMLLASIFHDGKKVLNTPQEFFQTCLAFYEAFNEKSSEEWQFMDVSLSAMAYNFPARYSNNLTNPKFWQKISDTALKRKAELESS